MYENLTAESIKSDILGRLSSDMQTNEGSFINDMASAVSIEIWKTYQSLNAIVPIAFVDDTSGEYIDKRCAEYGIIRKPGTKATAVMNLAGTDGTVIPEGKVFLTAEGLQFETGEEITISAGVATVIATAAEIGAEYNVDAGTITLQMTNISGLTSVSNQKAAGGTDAETDEALVKRLYDYLQNPATSGNIAHYKQWALSVDGVGGAKVQPLWDGPGTVKILIVGNNSEPVDTAIVEKCAGYIEANRPLGADVMVESAEGLNIDIAAEVTIDSTTTVETVQKTLAAQLTAYLKSISFDKYTIVYNRIAYMLLDISGVTDYTALTINNGTTNITIADNQVPVMGSVEVMA